MSVLQWDLAGNKTYETGVDKGVLYMPNSSGVYDNGVCWNGLIGVTESPSGAESTPIYADNVKYLNLVSAEQFTATLEAYTFPQEFQAYDGLGVPSVGVVVGQQSRNAFGLSYRTKLGNDIDGDDYGYKLHLVWGLSAAPSEKSYKSINESPEAITFSWALTSVAASVTNYKPTSLMVIDSTKVNASSLGDLEDYLWGTSTINPKLPTPDETIALFTSVATTVTPGVPTYNTTTHVVTIPASTNVKWTVNGTVNSSGTYTIPSGGTALVVVTANNGYVLASGVDNDWLFSY